jgi:hypothetical protein
VIVLQPFPEFGRRVEDFYLHGRWPQQSNRILDFWLSRTRSFVPEQLCGVDGQDAPRGNPGSD